MSYTHFTLEERKFLQELLAEGYSFRKIAEFLGRSPSSVSREVRRNHSKHPRRKSNNSYQYHAWRAQTLSIQRRRACKEYRMRPGTVEYAYTVAALMAAWSPEEIAMRWRKDHPKEKAFGTSTIYRAIKANRLEGISRKKHLRRRGKRRQTRNANYNTIHPDRLIEEWPEEIKKRLRIGDIEGDTVYGGVGKGYIFTGVDRRSRYLTATLIMSHTPEETRLAMMKALENFPVKSISLDNGSEFASFRQLEADLQVPIYFAKPHAPWQRGTNENTNGILRFFFPKGSDFRTITQDYLDFVVNLINNRPRKCLDWKTPAEVFAAESVALA